MIRKKPCAEQFLEAMCLDRCFQGLDLVSDALVGFAASPFGFCGSKPLALIDPGTFIPVFSNGPSIKSVQFFASSLARQDENALQCTQPVTSPAPSTDEEYCAGWERWLRGHLDIERGHLIAVLGEEFAATRNELLDRIEPQLEKQLGKISALELKLAQLSGAVDVLRGKEPPLPAKFPRVKAWKEDTVYYEGDVVAFAGGTYQARRDTVRVPGEKDWVCLATAGRSLTVRGTYNGDIDYRCLDVAIINGSSFIALKDMPASSGQEASAPRSLSLSN
jgi:hypothetical protein